MDMYHIFCAGFDVFYLFCTKHFQPLCKIELFHYGVVMKSGYTAVISTAFTTEGIMQLSFFIGNVDCIVDLRQPLQIMFHFLIVSEQKTNVPAGWNYKNEF